MADEYRSPIAKTLLITASFIVVVAGMKAAKSLLVPFLLALFISVVCGPLLFWLRRRGFRQWIAMSLVVLLILAVTFGIVTLVGSSIKDFTGALPTYEASLQEKIEVWSVWLQDNNIVVSDRKIEDYFNPGAIMKVVGNTLSELGNVLTNALLILLTVIFMLLEAASFRTKLSAALKRPESSLTGVSRFTESINRYMALKSMVSVGTGVLVAIWVAILGVDYPILWGVLAFLLNFIPNLGSIIAAVPPVLLALIQFGPGKAALVALGFVVVNFVIGNGVEPRIMGKGLGLSTLVVFLSLIFWGWVLGPVGMLLSVPLTMTVKIALESNEGTYWLAVLLGPPVELTTSDGK